MMGVSWIVPKLSDRLATSLSASSEVALRMDPSFEVKIAPDVVSAQHPSSIFAFFDGGEMHKTETLRTEDLDGLDPGVQVGLGEQGSDLLDPGERRDVSHDDTAEFGVEESEGQIDLFLRCFGHLGCVVDHLRPKHSVVDAESALEVGDLVFARMVEPQSLFGQIPAFTWSCLLN